MTRDLHAEHTDVLGELAGLQLGHRGKISRFRRLLTTTVWAMIQRLSYKRCSGAFNVYEASVARPRHK
jgi:hypothetical protein